jgi:hypothetical protein
MVNYWFIGIGINQYRFLPSLSYAQRDAEQLSDCLIQAGFAPQRCLLLTDNIGSVSADSHGPTAQSIRNQLARLPQLVKPGDVLLYFFSGHGVRVQDQDYLLPMEAEPNQIAATGIAAEWLLQQLKAIPTANIVLLLDANRSQLGQYGFGQQIVRLASQNGIAALLSCQANQFSHEPLTLRQGIFTAGLLATLQAGCLTLEQFVEALSQQLPSLSEEFWRPRQDVLATVPPHLRYQIVLPNQRDSEAVDQGELLVAVSGSGRVEPIAVAERLSLLSAIKIQLQRASGWLGSNRSTTKASPIQPGAVATFSPTLSPALSSSMLEPSDFSNETVLSDQFFWRRLLTQGGLIGSILLFGVILRNSGALIGSHSAQPQSLPAPSQATSVPSTALSPATPDPVGSSNIANSTPVVVVDPVLVMQAAQTAFQAGQYEDASRQLAQIPKPQRTPEQTQLMEQVNRALVNKAKTLLIRTRQPVAQNQVSDLVEAIKIARLIKPDQPLYQEAQQAIERWSRVILDMAQGRAARSNEKSVTDAANNYSVAIAAAQLVPNDQSSYSQAQQAIALWSQKTLDLANTRAANGDLDLAIQIGELVPPRTPAYAAAQEAIAKWRNQPAPAPVEKTTSENATRVQ